MLDLPRPRERSAGFGLEYHQSKTAIGSGAYRAKAGYSVRNRNLEFLPESHTDFIIAVLAEELGLIGVLLLLCLYGHRTARAVLGFAKRQPFGKLLAASLAVTFSSMSL